MATIQFTLSTDQQLRDCGLFEGIDYTTKENPEERKIIVKFDDQYIPQFAENFLTKVREGYFYDLDGDSISDLFHTPQERAAFIELAPGLEGEEAQQAQAFIDSGEHKYYWDGDGDVETDQDTFAMSDGDYEKFRGQLESYSPQPRTITLPGGVSVGRPPPSSSPSSRPDTDNPAPAVAPPAEPAEASTEGEVESALVYEVINSFPQYETRNPKALDIYILLIRDKDRAVTPLLITDVDNVVVPSNKHIPSSEEDFQDVKDYISSTHSHSGHRIDETYFSTAEVTHRKYRTEDIFTAQALVLTIPLVEASCNYSENNEGEGFIELDFQFRRDQISPVSDLFVLYQSEADAFEGCVYASEVKEGDLYQSFKLESDSTIVALALAAVKEAVELLELEDGQPLPENASDQLKAAYELVKPMTSEKRADLVVKLEAFQERLETLDTEGPSPAPAPGLSWMDAVKIGIVFSVVHAAGKGLLSLARRFVPYFVRIEAAGDAAFEVQRAEREQELRRQQDHFAKYGEDVTADVAGLTEDPAIGREREVRRLVRILTRPGKEIKAPNLLGPSGVGKTTIVESLAWRIQQGTIPELAGYRVISINISALAAAGSGISDIPSAVLGIIEQAKLEHGKVIIFLDEIHKLMDLGKHSTSDQGAAEIFKESTGRGQIKIITATTGPEYKKHVEPNVAFARRLVDVIVKEPLPKDQLTIIARRVGVYKDHYGLDIDPATLKKARKDSRRAGYKGAQPARTIALLVDLFEFVVEQNLELPEGQKKTQITVKDFDDFRAERRVEQLELKLESLITEVVELRNEIYLEGVDIEFDNEDNLRRLTKEAYTEAIRRIAYTKKQLLGFARLLGLDVEKYVGKQGDLASMLGADRSQVPDELVISTTKPSQEGDPGEVAEPEAPRAPDEAARAGEVDGVREVITSPEVSLAEIKEGYGDRAEKLPLSDVFDALVDVAEDKDSMEERVLEKAHELTNDAPEEIRTLAEEKLGEEATWEEKMAFYLEYIAKGKPKKDLTDADFTELMERAREMAGKFRGGTGNNGAPAAPAAGGGPAPAAGGNGAGGAGAKGPTVSPAVPDPADAEVADGAEVTEAPEPAPEVPPRPIEFELELNELARLFPKMKEPFAEPKVAVDAILLQLNEAERLIWTRRLFPEGTPQPRSAYDIAQRMESVVGQEKAQVIFTRTLMFCRDTNTSGPVLGVALLRANTISNDRAPDPAREMERTERALVKYVEFMEAKERAGKLEAEEQRRLDELRREMERREDMKRRPPVIPL